MEIDLYRDRDGDRYIDVCITIHQTIYTLRICVLYNIQIISH